MEAKDFAKQIIDFNKSAAKIGFDTISAFSGQAAKLTDSLVDIVPNAPAEVKKATSLYFTEQNKALANLQGYVEGQMNIDWTSKDAPAKSIEVLEQFNKQAFAQADNIKKESKKLTDKTTDQLPKEFKPLVNIWNDAINNSIGLFQDSMSKSFEISKDLLAKNEAATKAAK